MTGKGASSGRTSTEAAAGTIFSLKQEKSLNDIVTKILREYYTSDDPERVLASGQTLCQAVEEWLLHALDQIEEEADA